MRSILGQLMRRGKMLCHSARNHSRPGFSNLQGTLSEIVSGTELERKAQQHCPQYFGEYNQPEKRFYLSFNILLYCETGSLDKLPDLRSLFPYVIQNILISDLNSDSKF